MNIIKKIFYLTFFLLSFFNQQIFAQTNILSTTKATAQLSATCSISANNVSFGHLILPLTTQGASSSMSVLCSKNAPYTIGLSYSGVYGTGTTTTTQTGSSYQCTWWYFGACDGYAWVPVYTTTTSYYGYGKMIGAAKGDNVAYSISVPGNHSQVWNTGNNSYSATGTGNSQSIALNAQLVPGQSGSYYPTPDAYMDTVTANISF